MRKNLYRVRVEWIGDGEPNEQEKLEQKCIDGMECTGFALLLPHTGGQIIVTQHITPIELGACLVNEDVFKGAMKIAEIMENMQKAIPAKKAEG